jgi:hypothetical protein
MPAARGRVLLADVAARELTDEVYAKLVEDILIWRSEGARLNGHDPRYGAARDIRDLVADDSAGAALNPPTRLTPYAHTHTVPERVSRIVEAEDRLERVAAKVAQSHRLLRSQVQRRMTPPPARTTLGTLISGKRVSIRPGARIAVQDITTSGNHQVLGAPEVLSETAPGARRIDRQVLVTKYVRAQFTEPGDLIVTTHPAFGVLVDHDGFSIVDFPARVLRCRRREAAATLTPQVLAALLRAARETARPNGAIRAARRLEDFELPDLDDDEIRRLDALLSEIDQRRELLHEQLDALDEMRQLTSLGFADGTLTINPTAGV